MRNASTYKDQKDGGRKNNFTGKTHREKVETCCGKKKKQRSPLIYTSRFGSVRSGKKKGGKNIK